MILADVGLPLLIESWWLCLFDARPSSRNVAGAFWRVTFTLGVLP